MLERLDPEPLEERDGDRDVLDRHDADTPSPCHRVDLIVVFIGQAGRSDDDVPPRLDGGERVSPRHVGAGEVDQDVERRGQRLLERLGR